MEMDNNNNNNNSYEVAATMGDDQLDFSEFSVWNWQLDYPIDDVIIETAPLAQCDSSCSLFPPDYLFMQDEFYGLLGGENGFWDENLDNETSNESKKVESSAKDEKVITFENVSRYFYMPITQAAKELNVGVTLLKKKCRELGIPRWPHRKMKSLQTLIKNVQELDRAEGNAGDAQLRSALDILEQEKKLMEKEPGLQLKEETKRFRQACFKANYKKRRLMALEYNNHL